MKKKRKRRIPLGPIEGDILQHLSMGDMLMSFLLSARSSRAFYKEAYKRARIRYEYKRSIERLQIKGLLDSHDDTLFLTNKGKEVLEILSSRVAPAGNDWKGRWWLVMYDIPLSMSSYRFELRSILVASGFKKLQHSVWIHFRPCKELEIFLRHNPHMKKYIRYAETLPFPHMESLSDWRSLSSR